jgi:Peptidase family S41
MGKSVLVCLLLPGLFACRQGLNNNLLNEPVSVIKAKEEFGIFRALLYSSHPSLNLYTKNKRLMFILDSVENSISDKTNFGSLFSKYSYVTNEIGCSHTFIALDDEVYDSIYNKHFFFPYPVKLIENKLLVNVTNADLPAGTEIKNINGVSVADVLEQLSKYEPVEGFHRNTQKKIAAESFAANYFYEYGSQSKFYLLIKDTSGFQQTFTCNAVSLRESDNRYARNAYYFDRTACDYDFAIHEKDKAATLRITTLSYDGYEKRVAFENFCRNSFELLRLKKNIKSLIIDLRENTGGDLNNTFLLFSYLSNSDFTEFASANSKIKKIQYPQFLDADFASDYEHDVNEKLQKEFEKYKNSNYHQYIDSFIEKWQPDKYRFSGKVFVVVNSSVMSAASYLALMIQSSGTGKIVGEETRGGNTSGNGFTNLEYRLPYSGSRLTFPYAHIIYSAKSGTDIGRGLIPDYEIPDSHESFKENLDRQITFIKDSLILNN